MMAPMTTTAVIAAEEPVLRLTSQSAVAATVMTAPMVAANRLGGPAVGRFAARHGGSDPPLTSWAIGLAFGPSAARRVKSTARTA